MSWKFAGALINSYAFRMGFLVAVKIATGSYGFLRPSI